MRTDTSFTPAHPAGRRRQLNRLGARFDERPAEATHQRERKHGLAAAAGQRIPTPANSSRPYRNFLAPDRYRSFLPLQSLSNPSLSAPAAPPPVPVRILIKRAFRRILWWKESSDGYNPCPYGRSAGSNDQPAWSRYRRLFFAEGYL